MAKRKRKPSGPPGGAGGGAAGKSPRLQKPREPKIRMAKVETEDLPGGADYHDRRAEFWRKFDAAHAADPMIFYDDPDGPQVPGRRSIEKLSTRVGELLAVTGEKAPPGFATVVADRPWAAEHNLRSLVAFSNFWFALTATGVARSGMFGDWRMFGVNRWPIVTEIALHLLLDLCATMEARWGLHVAEGLKVVLPANSPHVRAISYLCPGPLHPASKGERATTHLKGDIEVTGEEWAGLKWAKGALDEGLAWKATDEKGDAGDFGGVIERAKPETAAERLLTLMKGRKAATFAEIRAEVWPGRKVKDSTIVSNVTRAKDLIGEGPARRELKVDTKWPGKRVYWVAVPTPGEADA